VVISFTAQASGVTLHEPVFWDFSVHNGLSESIDFDLGHNCKSNFEFTITEPDGSVIVTDRLSEEDFGLIGRVSLKPTEQHNQRLLLDEWYHFVKPGNYKIEGRLTDLIRTQSGRSVNPILSEPLSLQVRSRNSDRLREVCQALTRTAVESSAVLEATEAALALSYIRDPIAVPYLETALREGRMARPYAITGLARIANKEAIEILISTMNGQDRESGTLARFALHKTKDEIQDPELSERIRMALGSQGDG
jgi:hypothetical protein